MKDVQIITSRENRKLQHFRKVRSGKVGDTVFIEGVRLAEEALRSEVDITDVLVSAGFRGNNPRGRTILDALAAKNVRISETDPRLFREVADTVNSQGIILLAARPSTGPFASELLKDNKAIFLYLQAISDPSNIGAVLRSAEAAGVEGVVFSSGSADPFSPKALRSGLGANFRVKIWAQASLPEASGWIKEINGRTVAADVSGKLKHFELDWSGSTLLVMGSEAHGLDDADLEFADEIIRIPMKNGVESLNLAVATAVILFEAERQRSIGT